MKKIIAIVLAICLCTLPLMGCNKKTTIEKEVYTDQRLDDDGTLLASCRYEKPVISGGNKGVSENINAYFDDWMNSNLSWFNEVAGMAETDYHLQKEVQGSAWEDDSFWFADENTISYWNNKNILTVIIESYSFTGGVHGTYGRSAVMFDLEDGHTFTLSDMVSNFQTLDTIIQEAINEQIETKISQGETGYFEDYEDCVKEWSSRTCYLNDTGLVVVFSIYDIASYETGEQQFTIPYSQIQDCLSLSAMKMLELD